MAPSGLIEVPSGLIARGLSDHEALVNHVRNCLLKMVGSHSSVGRAEGHAHSAG